MVYRNALTYRNGYLYGASDSSPGAKPPNSASRDGLPWGSGRPDSHAVKAAFRHAEAADSLQELPWAFAETASTQASLVARTRIESGNLTSMPWAKFALQLMEGATLCSGRLLPGAQAGALRWDAIAALQRTLSLRLAALLARGSHSSLPWQHHQAAEAGTSLLWREITARGGFVALPWSPAAARSDSTLIVWPQPPPVDDDTILVPDLPVYVMLPTMTAVRLPDRTQLPLLSISLNEERGGYPWSFSAPMRREGLDLVNPDDGSLPEIEVTINGYPWTLVVEAYDDNRRFGSNTVSLRGFSRSALLAAPHAPTRTYTAEDDRTAAQLAQEELPPGWTLVWDAVDWLVPGGTFSYADLAPIEAIARLASAIGAAIESDPQERKIRVAPSYPESPWAWGQAAPYAVLPAGVLASGSSTWEGGTNADGVYVYAQNAGSGAFVKLAGSAGAMQLPMVVDPLVVHADAQRERGRQELAAAGRARTVQRTVPLFPTPAPEGMPELGVVRTGVLLEVEDTDETWVGMVVGVRIDAQRQGRALSVRQHLTIQRQYR